MQPSARDQARELIVVARSKTHEATVGAMRELVIVAGSNTHEAAVTLEHVVAKSETHEAVVGG